MSAPVVCDAAETVGGEVEHLRIPGVRAKRPAVAEGDHWAVFLAPVFVINRGAVLHRHHAHLFSSLFIRMSVLERCDSPVRSTSGLSAAEQCEIFVRTAKRPKDFYQNYEMAAR